jgi:hypothetical protein
MRHAAQFSGKELIVLAPSGNLHYAVEVVGGAFPPTPLSNLSSVFKFP